MKRRLCAARNPKAANAIPPLAGRMVNDLPARLYAVTGGDFPSDKMLLT